MGRGGVERELGGSEEGVGGGVAPVKHGLPELNHLEYRLRMSEKE